jgi:hypothetical protein
MRAYLLVILCFFSGCSLFEDVDQITYFPGNAEADMDLGMPDTPVDMPDSSDMPDQDAPDLPNDADMPVLEGCNLDGCPTLAEACNIETGECEACAEGDTNLICRNNTVCVAGECVCPEGSNLCNGICVAQSAQSCGESCEVCPGVLNGTPTCENNRCSADCEDDLVLSGTTCVEGGGTCGVAAPLDGRCDLVVQEGCNAAFELCSAFPTGGSDCQSQADCELGELCAVLPPQPQTRCVSFTSACASAVTVIDRCSTAADCTGGKSCMGGFCGPCTQDTDCEAEQSCLGGVCRGVYNATLQEGESCAATEERCAPGLICLANVCKKLCVSSNGAGCEAEQFCRPLQEAGSVGVCESSC